MAGTWAANQALKVLREEEIARYNTKIGSMSFMIERIDPQRCSCGGCQEGKSKPLEEVSRDEILAYLHGNGAKENNSGLMFFKHHYWNPWEKEWQFQIGGYQIRLSGQPRMWL